MQIDGEDLGIPEAENGVSESVATAMLFVTVKPQLLVKAPKANDATFGTEEAGRTLNPKRKAELSLILSAEAKHVENAWVENFWLCDGILNCFKDLRVGALGFVASAANVFEMSDEMAMRVVSVVELFLFGSVAEVEFKTIGENHNRGELGVEILVSSFVFEEDDFIRLWESKNLFAVSSAIQDWLISKIAMELMQQGGMMTVLSALVTALAWPAALLAGTDFIDSTRVEHVYAVECSHMADMAKEKVETTAGIRIHTVFESKLGFTVYPSPQVSTSVVESYNSVLSTHSLLEHTDVVVLLDYESKISLNGSANNSNSTAPATKARTGWLSIALIPNPIAFLLLAASDSPLALHTGTTLIGLSSGFIFAAAGINTIAVGITVNALGHGDIDWLRTVIEQAAGVFVQLCAWTSWIFSRLLENAVVYCFFWFQVDIG